MTKLINKRNENYTKNNEIFINDKFKNEIVLNYYDVWALQTYDKYEKLGNDNITIIDDNIKRLKKIKESRVKKSLQKS